MADRSTVLEPAYMLAEDIRRVLPELYQGLIEDLDELSRRIKARGFKIPVLLDLPELGKLYDKGLSSGFFRHDLWPQTLKRKGSKPHLFERLIRHSYFGATWTCADPEPECVFFTRCFLYLYKKLDHKPKEGSLLEAVNKFVETDAELRSASHNWFDPESPYGRSALRFSGSIGGVSSQEEALLRTLDRVVDRVQFPELDWRSVVPKHGPGAVADLKRGKDKYDFPLWPAKLASIFPREYFDSHRGDLESEPCYLDYTGRISTASCRSSKDLAWLYGIARLHDVPKTFKGPRLISVEPTAQQFLQGGLLKWIRQNMSVHCRRSISFHDQTPSREGALRASLRGELATVDLSEASDRLSCWTVERVVRTPSVLSALMATRTPFLSLHKYKDVDALQLKKFAGMGSAVTFPVQSIVYWCCCIAAVAFCERGSSTITSSHLRRYSKKVRVFGDDIILPSSAVPYLAQILGLLQLKINVGKTHIQGYFRESCGMDAYRGEDVTPFYLSAFELKKGSPKDLVSWVDARNNAYSKGLWVLARWMESKVPQRTSEWIARSNLDLGVLKYHTYANVTFAKARRENHDLQLTEISGLALICKEVRVVRGTETDLLQWFLESPGPDSFWEPGYLSSTSTFTRPAWVSLPGRVEAQRTPR